jgi:hypothetical protein
MSSQTHTRSLLGRSRVHVQGRVEDCRSLGGGDRLRQDRADIRRAVSRVCQQGAHRRAQLVRRCFACACAGCVTARRCRAVLTYVNTTSTNIVGTGGVGLPSAMSGATTDNVVSYALIRFTHNNRVLYTFASVIGRNAPVEQRQMCVDHRLAVLNMCGVSVRCEHARARTLKCVVPGCRQRHLAQQRRRVAATHAEHGQAGADRRSRVRRV